MNAARKQVNRVFMFTWLPGWSNVETDSFGTRKAN